MFFWAVDVFMVKQRYQNQTTLKGNVAMKSKMVSMLLLISICSYADIEICLGEGLNFVEYEKKFDEKRANFYEAKEKINSEYAQKITMINNESAELRKDIDNLNRKFELIENKKAENIGITLGVNAIEAIAIKTIYSVLLVPGIYIYPRILEFFFIITLININVYLYFYRKKFLIRNKRLIIVFTVILWLLFFAPLIFGSKAIAREVSPLESQIEQAASIFKMTRLQRIILKMEEYEGRSGETIKLQEVKTVNDKLIPLKEVTAGNADFYYTLAALYLAEGRKGDAVDAVKMIYNPETKLADKQLDIAAKGIEFLIDNGQLESAGVAVKAILGRIQSFDLAVELMKYFEKAGMRETAIEILKQSVKLGIKDESNTTSLIKRFIDNDQLDYARVAIEQSMNQVSNINSGIMLIDYAIKAGFEDLVKYGIDRCSRDLEPGESLDEFINFLLENNLKESAINIISQAIDKTNKNQNNRVDNLFNLTCLSIRHELYEQATVAAEKLFIALKRDVESFNVKPPHILPIERNLPNDDGLISFATFFGAIREKSGFQDKAEVAYRNAIKWRLDEIIKSYGFEGTQNINDFYFAIPSIKKNNNINLEAYDIIYSILEDRYIANQEEILKNELHNIQNEHENLKKIHQEKKFAIEKIKSENSAIFANLASHLMRTIALILLIIVLLIGCFISAWEYSNSINEHKIFAFISKFFESIGWVQIMTVINLVLGLFVVFISQMLLIFQRKEQLMQKFINLSTEHETV